MKPKPSLRSFLALVGSSLLTIPSASAVTVTKLDTTTLANGASDWSAAPGTADTCSYHTGSLITLANSVNQTLGGNLSIGNLYLRSLLSPPAIHIKADGNTLTLNSASLASASDGLTALDQQGNTLTTTIIDCPITIADNATFRNSAGGWLILNGAIGETGGARSLVLMSKTSNGQPGSFWLTGANSYSGGTHIGKLAASYSYGSGTLVALSGSATLGNSTGSLSVGATGNGTVLDLGGTSQTLAAVNFGTGNAANGPTVQNGSISGTSFSGYGVIGANLSGAGLYTLNSTGQRSILSGTNTYLGGTTITLGTLVATKPAALPLSGNISLAASANAILAIRAGGAGEWGASDLTNLLGYGSLSVGAAGTLAIDTTGGNFSYSSTIAGPTPANLALTKQGPNTLTLTGANTYQKVTTIDRGTLAVDNTAGGSLDGTSPLTFTGTGAFTYNTASNPQGLGALTLSGGEGTVQLTRSGTATLTLASLAARTAGRTGNLSFNGGAPSASDGIQFTTAAAGFINQGIFYNGADYAFMDAANTFVRNPVYGADSGFTTADTITPGTHTLLTATPAAQSTVTLNTLKLTGSGVGFPLTAATDVLTLAKGGILKTGGGAGTLSGGYVQSTDSALPTPLHDLVVRTDSASDALTVNSVLGAAVPSQTGSCTNANNKITGLNTTNMYLGMRVLVQNRNSFGANTPSTTITAIGPNPGEITVANNFNLTTGSYALFFGGNSLTKSGAGTLTLAADSNLLNVFLNGGQLNINTTNALGVGTIPSVTGNQTAPSTLTINEGTTIDNTSGATLATANYNNVWNGSFTFTGTDDLWLSNLGSLTMPNDITVTTSTLGKTLKCGSGLLPTMARLTKRGPGTLQFDANGSQAQMGGLNVYEGVYATSLQYSYWNSLCAGPMSLGDPTPANSRNAVINCVNVGQQGSLIDVQAGSSGTLAIRSDISTSLHSLLKLNNNLTLATPAGQTFSQLGLVSGSGTLNIGVPSGGLSSITVYGVSKSLNNVGTVRLLNKNPYTGNTVINSGTLALGPLASINATANISIASGTTFDVSQQTSPYTLTASNTLNASGTGTTAGTTAARIVGPSAGVVSFAARPITLTWAGDISGTDTDSPALHVSQGALTLNNNAFTINGSTLGEGTYRLIQVGNGTTGTLNENVTPSYTVSGTAIDGTKTNVISSDGSGNLILTVTPGGGGSPYETWADTNAPTGNPDDDFDGDGVSNAVEFVLGGDKDTNDLGKLPVAATSGTDMTFTFTRDETSVDPGSVAVTIEVSNDLVTWDAGSSPYAVPDADTAGVINPGVTVVDNGSTHTVTLTIPQAPDTKKFARLKVAITP